MRIGTLLLFQSFVLTLVIVMFSLISFAPSAQAIAGIVEAVAGAGAVLMLGLGIWFHRLPAGHWVNHNGPLRSAFTLSGSALTVFVALIL